MLSPQNLTDMIVDTADEVFDLFGPGQSKKRYTKEIQRSLRKQGLDAWRDYNVNTVPKGGTRVGTLNLMVERRVGILIELKEGEPTPRRCGHLRHLLTLQGLDAGVVLNFTSFGVLWKPVRPSKSPSSSDVGTTGSHASVSAPSMTGGAGGDLG